MNKSIVAYIVAAAAIAALTYFIASAKKEPRTMPQVATTTLPVDRGDKSAIEPAAPQPKTAAKRAPKAPEAKGSKVDIIPLAEGANVVIGTEYASEIGALMNRKNPLNLADGQKDQIQAAYEQFRLEQDAIASNLASARVVDAKTVEVTIPAYNGTSMLPGFTRRVDSILGLGQGQKFLDTYKEELYQLNRGFGNQPQKIKLEDKEGIIEISHSYNTSTTPGLASTGGTVVSQVRRERLGQYAYLQKFLPRGK